jgi:hypothetical protein
MDADSLLEECLGWLGQLLAGEVDDGDWPAIQDTYNDVEEYLNGDRTPCIKSSLMGRGES